MSLLLWDIVSLTILLWTILPLVFWFVTHKSVYLWIMLGSVILQVFIKLSRYIQYPKTWKHIVMRPKKAMNCSLFNQGGIYKNRIGMPSGHVLITTFVLISIGLIMKSHLSSYTNVWFIGSILIISLMCISRIKRHCHNLAQVIIGAICGLLSAILWILLYNKIVAKNL